MIRVTWKFFVTVLSAALVLCAQEASAGPYAKLAAQVQADGGYLRLYADDVLQSASSDVRVAAARGICHKIALEGVTVSRIDIIATDGQTLLRSVDSATLQGC